MKKTTQVVWFHTLLGKTLFPVEKGNPELRLEPLDQLLATSCACFVMSRIPKTPS